MSTPNPAYTTPAKQPTVDFSYENHGSICLFRPRTDAAKAWLAEHCPPDADHQYFGNAIVVEPRYAEGLNTYMTEDGLIVG